MARHFATFMKMKDKKNVQLYLQAFVKTCSRLGFTDFDLAKLTAVLRRIHKDPSQVPLPVLIDYLLVLALSPGTDIDPKSEKWVEAALDLVEDAFSGLETRTVNGQALNYFKSFSTEEKIYNKVMLRPKDLYLDYQKIHKDIIPPSDDSVTESVSEEEEQEAEAGFEGEGENPGFILYSQEEAEQIRPSEAE